MIRPLPDPINVLSATIYTGIGGGESLQLHFMRALAAESRIRMHLLTPRDGAFPQAARELGVQTHILPWRGTTTAFIPRLWALFPVVGKLRSFLQTHHIHAVLSDYHTLPFLVPAAHALNIPVWWNAFGWWFPIHVWQRHFFQHRIDRITAITQAVKDKLLGSPPRLDPDLITVRIPGVDIARYHPDQISGASVRAACGVDNDTPLIGMVARFQNVKGHLDFLAAALRILDQIPNAHFALAGENVFAVSKDEEYKRQVIATVENHPLLRERVHFLGFWDDSREVLRACDVMVCASWFESLSMVALESMALGTPFVSTRVGGPSETVIDTVTGYLVEPKDPDALADKVILLLRDSALRARIGMASRAHVAANFSASGYAAWIAENVYHMIGKR